MTKKTKALAPEAIEVLREEPGSPPPNPKLWAKKLAAVCADLLALCGEIDPAEAWAVNHKDDVTLELLCVSRKRTS